MKEITPEHADQLRRRANGCAKTALIIFITLLSILLAILAISGGVR